MKKVALFVIMITMLILASPVLDAAMVTLPNAGRIPDAEFDRFPVELSKLSAAKQADLGLHPERLTATWCGLNWQGKRQTFEFRCLDAGTVVLKDALGVVR